MMRAVGLAALIMSMACVAKAEPPHLRPEVMAAHRFEVPWREAVVGLTANVRTADGRQHAREFLLTHYRPPGDGPFPLAILHHGRGPERSLPSRTRSVAFAGYFVRRGFAVFVPTRIGYGGLGSQPDPESGAAACSDDSIALQIDAVVAHTRAALEFAAGQPWIDPSRVVLAGQSVGGYTSVAAAARDIPGLIAVVNLAGGVGARVQGKSGVVCPERVTRAFARAGQAARVPTLWLYARNDRYWGSELPRSWYRAFKDAGGKAELVFTPDVDGDGHSEISSSVHVWRAPADAFLARFGVKSPVMNEAPASSGFASIDDVSRLPPGRTTIADGYRRFLRTDLPRAFVVAPNGWWIYRSGQPKALAEALERCASETKTTCKPYAVDDVVVWVP